MARSKMIQKRNKHKKQIAQAMRKEVRKFLKTRLREILPDKDEEVRHKILCEVVDFGCDSAWAQGWDDCKNRWFRRWLS